MKKAFFVFLMLAVSVTLAGCGKQKTEVFSGSMEDLMEKGEPMKCTYSMDQDGQSFTGVVYTANDKARSEVEMMYDSEMQTVYSITDSEWLYSWSTFQEQGTKMNLKELEDLVEEDEEIDTGEIDKTLKQDFDFECQSWSPDYSIFMPPTDVEFMDMTETLKAFSDFGESEDFNDMVDAACDACQLMPTQEEIDSCLEELDCE